MPGTNLTREEAKERASLIAPTEYVVELDLSGESTERFGSVTTIRFAGTQGGSTFADLVDGEISSISLNGVSIDPATYVDSRIPLHDLAAENELRVEATCLYSHSGEGLHRFVDPADDLETSSSNALLKSLEEPPAGTFFLLVAHRPARLLPTIRSRCRVLRFAPLPDEAVAGLIAAEAPEADAATRAAAVTAAGGSPGAALDFVAQDLGALDTLMRKIAGEGDPQFVLRGKLAEEIGARPDRARIAAALDLARANLAQMVQHAPKERLTAIVEAHAELVRLTGQAPTYNFDPGLLVMQIGGLLASAAAASQPANV